MRTRTRETGDGKILSCSVRAILPKSVPLEEVRDVELECGDVQVWEMNQPISTYVDDTAVEASCTSNSPTKSGVHSILKSWLAAQPGSVVAAIISESDDREFRRLAIRASGNRSR